MSNKEIRIVDEKKGIIQITCSDERWYAFPGEDKSTGLPKYTFLPSVTWICSVYPKGIGFYKYLASMNWDDSQAIMKAAGNKGSKVHNACCVVERDGKLSIDATFQNNDTGFQESLTTEELECIYSFTKWHNDTNPQLLASEMTVLGSFYAGSLDRIYRINGVIYIVDLKTSSSIWEDYKLQISAYSHANIDYKALSITDIEWSQRKLAILQVGYKLNKNGYKFTEIEDKFELFLIAHKLWLNENADAKPKQKDFPLILTIKKETKNEIHQDNK